MMHLEDHRQGTLAHAPDEATLPRLAARLAGLFAPPRKPDRSGLFVASGNAGFLSAREFLRMETDSSR